MLQFLLWNIWQDSLLLTPILNELGSIPQSPQSTMGRELARPMPCSFMTCICVHSIDNSRPYSMSHQPDVEAGSLEARADIRGRVKGICSEL